MPFLFVRTISWYCFIIFPATSGFSTFSASSFSSSVSMTLLIVIDLIFVKTLCLLGVSRVSPQLKTKNNRYTKNPKHSFQTKMRIRWAQSKSFWTWLMVVKVLCHRHRLRHRKIVFQINRIRKKILKSFG